MVNHAVHMTTRPPRRALVFCLQTASYSMIFAVKIIACTVPCTVIAAVEINTVANAVYQHNFPEGFTVDDFASFDADMFVMSPPCQPFTRVGLKGDKNDARTNAFFNIMRNLPGLPKKPTYLLVENVKGFETSETRNFLVETLQKCNYIFQEFLLSPMDIGIPNQRVRYFMLAKQLPLQFKEEYGSQLVRHRVTVPLSNEDSRLVCNSSMVSTQAQTNLELRTGQDESGMASKNEQNNDTRTDERGNNSQLYRELTVDDKASSTRTNTAKSSSCENMVSSTQQKEQEMSEVNGERKVGGYLQPDLHADSMAEYLIPDRILLKFGHMMDIVTTEDSKTRCFTKAYAYYVEGTGSVLRTDLSTDMSAAFSAGSYSEDERLERLRALRLRYFTPREVANLHHFPQDFGFPECSTKKQRYRLLGNSLNVTLVSQLISYMVA